MQTLLPRNAPTDVARMGGVLSSTAMLEADEEMREIKREIIESRGLVIKTSNLVNALSADVKAIAKRQAGYERRFNWNSGAAYALFAFLSFAGLYMASDARISALRSEQVDLVKEVESLRTQLSKEREITRRRKVAEAEALKFYEAVEKKQRRDVVSGFGRLEREELSPVERAFFKKTAESFQVDLAVATYQEGLSLMQSGRYAEAAEKFEQSLEHDDRGANVPLVQIELARAYQRLDRHGEALLLARSVAAQETDPNLHDDATWLISQCAENLDKLDDARESLRTLVRKWPRSEFAPEARKRLGDINQRILQQKKS